MKFKKISVAIGILILVIVSEIVYLGKYRANFLNSLFINAGQAQYKEEDYKKFAELVIERCSSSNFAPDCYNDEITRLMASFEGSISMEEAFKVTRFVQEKDTRYNYCHVLAHNVAAYETKKDISKWKNVITRCPYAMCNNGCAHGAIMERYKAETLTDVQIEEAKVELRDVCEPRNEWKPRTIEISMCYHAIGHLLMYMTAANIDKSISLCEYVGGNRDSTGISQVPTCVEGVFMSIFQPLEPEDEALIKDFVQTKDTVRTFCQKYQGESFHACNRESWPLFRSKMLTPEGLVEFCSYTNEKEYQGRCYSAMMNNVTVKQVVEKNHDLLPITNYCSNMPKEWTGHCFAHAARRLMQLDPALYTDQSVEICKIARGVKSEDGERCFSLLYYNFAKISFLPGTQESREACHKLPNPWDEKCLKITK